MKIKNWSKFQHFKDRKPPWVKLYRDVLDDMEWYELDPLASKVLVMCWLIASEDEGRLPSAKTLAFRLRMSEKQTLDCLNKLSHWLEQDDINEISNGYQNDSLETEIETETKKETKATKVATPEGVSESVWNDFVKHRKAKRAQITERVIDAIALQAKIAGWTLEAALAETTVRNWQTFKAEWVEQKPVFQNKFDLSRTTTPARPDRDPALVKADQDLANARPIPFEVLAKMAALRKAVA
jgi:hypothetical protein